MKCRKEVISQEQADIIFYLILGVISVGIGYLSLGKGFDFDVYFSFQGDGTYLSALIKSIQENGITGVWFNSRIGAPEVSALLDFPAQDLLMSAIIWILSVFTKSIPRIAYQYLLFTFFINALSMSLLLRKMNVNHVVSFVIAILFTAAPFHFFRYLGHLTLSNYMSVPIALYLAMDILGVIEETKSKWKMYVCILLFGLGFGYYYAFGLMILAVAYFIKFIRLENKKEILAKVWILFFAIFTIAISLMPKIVYSIGKGGNPLAGKRLFYEQEIYGLKIVQLLLPPSYSRFSALSRINMEYSSKAPLVNENATASLGVVASVGFFILCTLFLLSFASNRQRDGEDNLLKDFLSLSVLVLILTGTIGGFGEIFNFFVTAQIRCYNRSSIFIAGLSFLVLAVLLHKMYIWSKRYVCILCIFMLIIGLADQVNIASDNWQEPLKSTQAVYEDFFAEVEEKFHGDEMIYQLPYLEFPEVSATYDYKHFIAYLFTDKLRWSYGGIKGRNLKAGQLYIDEGMSYRFLQEIKDMGFQAVYIDLAGYEDGGSQVLSFYNSIGVEPVISRDGTLYLYDLTEVGITEEEMVTGYSFVNTWAAEYGMKLDKNEKAVLAKGIGMMEQDAIQKLYFGISHVADHYTDQEFVDFLYRAVLDRNETDAERDYWIGEIQNGVSRETVFDRFLSSEEFRIQKGYENIQ